MTLNHNLIPRTLLGTGELWLIFSRKVASVTHLNSLTVRPSVDQRSSSGVDPFTVSRRFDSTEFAIILMLIDFSFRENKILPNTGHFPCHLCPVAINFLYHQGILYVSVGLSCFEWCLGLFSLNLALLSQKVTQEQLGRGFRYRWSIPRAAAMPALEVTGLSLHLMAPTMSFHEVVKAVTWPRLGNKVCRSFWYDTCWSSQVAWAMSSPLIHPNSYCKVHLEIDVAMTLPVFGCSFSSVLDCLECLWFSTIRC